MAKVYVIGAAKGGTAKTVSSYNMAYAMAEMGKRVLAVDMDPQANLTTCFGVDDAAEVPVTIGHLMMAVLDEEELPDASEYVWEREGVDFIPASMMLSAVDAKLRLEMGTERVLSRILDEVKDGYDTVIIDTCPSMGALTINALSAADYVIVTANPQLLAMKGLQDFLKTVSKIKNRINDRLQVVGILLTMCEGRTNLCKTITEEVQDTFKGKLKVFQSMVPNTVKVGESVYYGQPLMEYAPETKACLAPYGYRKNPKDKHQLLIDDEAAEIVRQIFREYLGGKPAYKIAQGLNESGVETPAEHIKRMVGYDIQQNYRGKIVWSGETILRILRNETYVGTFVYHKYVQISVGGKAKKLLDPSEWKRVEDNHDAIIDRNEFDEVQRLLDRNKRARVTRPSHPLSYKVECGLCHHNMRHEWSGKPKFSCAHMYLDKGNWHERNSIRDEDLERIVLSALQKQMDLRADAAAISEERRKGQQGRLDEEEKKLGELKVSLDRLHGDQMTAFEAHKNGTTDKETYLKQKELYDRMEEKLDEGIRELAAAVKAMEQELDKMPEGLAADAERIMVDKLTKEVADAFVERVIVKPGQQVEIEWKFEK